MKRTLRVLTGPRALGASLLTAAALLLALPASQAAAQNPDPVRETHGSWEIRCSKPEACYMVQEKIGPQGQPQMAMILRKLKEPSTDTPPLVSRAELIIPLGMWIINGVGMSVDAEKLGAMPIERCFKYGCVSRPLMRQDVIDKLKAGGEVVFTMLIDTSQPPIEMRLSLAGFTAAYNAL